MLVSGAAILADGLTQILSRARIPFGRTAVAKGKFPIIYLGLQGAHTWGIGRSDADCDASVGDGMMKLVQHEANG